MHGHTIVDIWYQTDMGNTDNIRVSNHMYILV